jgi:hypothetical protein
LDLLEFFMGGGSIYSFEKSTAGGTYVKGTYPIWILFGGQHKQNFQTEWIHHDYFRVIAVAEQPDILTITHVVRLNK